LRLVEKNILGLLLDICNRDRSSSCCYRPHLCLSSQIYFNAFRWT